MFLKTSSVLIVLLALAYAHTMTDDEEYMSPPGENTPPEATPGGGGRSPLSTNLMNSGIDPAFSRVDRSSQS